VVSKLLFDLFYLFPIYFHLLNCRVQKGDTTIDTIKVDDRKKPEILPVYHDEVKPDKSVPREQNVHLVPNVELSKLLLSPQQNMPAKPGGQEATKLLGKFCFSKPILIHRSCNGAHQSYFDTGPTSPYAPIVALRYCPNSGADLAPINLTVTPETSITRKVQEHASPDRLLALINVHC
jgi:hypothetical protein